MISNAIEIEGLRELEEALRKLPDELKGEAGRIVEFWANAAATEIRREYSIGPTGHLVGGVYTTNFERGRFSAVTQVRSAAPHAWLYDNGSAQREYLTKTGKKHPTGAMGAGRASHWRPHHTFVTAVIRSRRKMWDALAAMVRRKGLLVTGTANG